MNRQDAKREIQQTLGLVPGFFDQIPEVHIGHMWESMRNLQLREGRIPAKYQQLIMLAVSTYAKCKYCTDFHTQVAKTLGASEDEIVETALLVGNTAEFSNFLGGVQYDFDLFKREVRAVCGNMARGNGSSKSDVAGRPPPPPRS
jgi:AhpD family alkylhydroperoxidase